MSPVLSDVLTASKLFDINPGKQQKNRFGLLRCNKNECLYKTDTKECDD